MVKSIIKPRTVTRDAQRERHAKSAIVLENSPLGNMPNGRSSLRRECSILFCGMQEGRGKMGKNRSGGTGNCFSGAPRSVELVGCCLPLSFLHCFGTMNSRLV
jgi:hypothetical protein